MKIIKCIALVLSAALLPLACTKDQDAIALPQASATMPPPSTNPPPAPVPVKQGHDRLTTATGSILSGTTRPSRQSDLAPQVSGMLLRVMVQEGDRIHKGQALVQLDPRDFKLAIRQAMAARNIVQTQLAAVKVEWRRLQSLLRARAIPSGNFDKVDAQFKLAQAQLAQAEVAVDRAKASLAKTIIRAPYAAVVTRKMLDEGAYATVMPPSPVVRVEELDRLEVRISVPEGAINSVQQGTAVTLLFRAIQKSIPAKIDRVIPSLDPQTRSFSAIVVLANPQHELRPGMFVEVRLDSEDQE